MSSGPTYTPGPWKWDAGVIPPDGPQRYADVYTGDGETIVAQFNDLIPEGRANARLIAAAPDLLEALKSYVNVGDRFTGEPGEDAATWCEAEAEARAAIAKAEGR